MALYALGDLHLSFQADNHGCFRESLETHEERLKVCKQNRKAEDTLVLTGDHSGEENWKNAGRSCVHREPSGEKDPAQGKS